MSGCEPMNKLRLVTLIEIRARVEPLLYAHWKVFSKRHQYARLEAVGRLILVAVELKDELIGYASYILAPMQHHGTTVVAQCDAIYICPEHRHGVLAQRLLKFCEAEASRRGARVATSSANSG